MNWEENISKKASFGKFIMYACYIITRQKKLSLKKRIPFYKDVGKGYAP